MTSYLLTGGYVVDPANEVNHQCDVLIIEGRIGAVGRNISPPKHIPSIVCDGLLVTPGLIDLHTHVFAGGTPLGVIPDLHCLKRGGVTTLCDAGSAGADTFDDFNVNVISKSPVNVKAFLHVSKIGLKHAGCAGVGSSQGECDDLSDVDVDACARKIARNPDEIRGLKVRLAKPLTDEGQNEMEVFKRALEARDCAELPLMVHHALSTLPVGNRASQDGSEDLACPDSLNPGDIYTHMFHGVRGHIIDQENNKLEVFDSVLDAKKRGVVFDLGHGAGSFSWEVAEIATNCGLWPDTISTDLHSDSLDGPVYDLPAVMSKLLHLGMSQVEVVRAVTATPAAVLGLSDQLGSLTPGRDADVTLLKVVDSAGTPMEDGFGETRKVERVLEAAKVFQKGGLFDCDTRQTMANPQRLSELRSSMNNLKKLYGPGFIDE